MSLYFGIPILMIASVLQSVWVERFHIFGGRPDLPLSLVVAWAIIRGANEGTLWGFVAGLSCDALSGGTFGLWTFTLTAVGFLAGQSWVHALGPTVIRLALMSALGTLLGHTLLLGTMAIVGYSVNWIYNLQTVAVPAMLLNLVLSPFAFRFLVWFHQQALPRGSMLE